MTDPYAETDDWIVPATRPHSDAQPVSAPEPSGSTPEAGEGARLARYAEAIQACYDLDTEVSVQEWDERVAHAVMAVADQETAELRAEVVRLTEFHHDVSEAIKPYEPNPGTVTVAQRIGILGRGRKVSDEQHEHFAREAKRARDARDWWRESALGEKARAEAAEAESARLASEQRELAAQVAGLRSVVAKVKELADEWEAALEGADDYFKASEWAACLRANLPNLRAALASVAPDAATPGEAKKRHLHSCFPSDCDHIANRCCIDCCEPGGWAEPTASSAGDKAGETHPRTITGVVVPPRREGIVG